MEAPPGHPMRNLDAAKRMRDWIALHQAALGRDEILRHRFVAIRLSDGGSDGQVYDSRTAAMDHQLNPEWCGYFQIPLERWSEQVCDVLLYYVRRRYDAGDRPEGKHHLIIPNRLEDLL